MSSIVPKISIVTPSYNQGAFLEKTIRSVLDQNYPNLEYIIIDGGSTDNSVDIIRKYEGKLSYWVSEKDKGQSDALNKGLSRTTGDIIAWINSDDWYEPDVFKNVVDFFKEKKAEVVYGDCKMWYSDGSEPVNIKPGKVTFQSMTHYWKGNFIPPQPSIFFSAKALALAGKIDERLNYAMDMDLWLRMAVNFNFHYIPACLSNYLVHDTSKTGSGFKKFMPEWKKVSKKYVRQASVGQRIRFCAARMEYFFFYFRNAIRRRLSVNK